MNPATSHIDWFKWQGVSSAEYDLVVLNQPSRIRPSERSEPVTIPGLSGSLTVLENQDEPVFDDIALPFNCLIDKPDEVITVRGRTGTRLDLISGWLKGYGEIETPSRPGGFYKGMLANQVDFTKIVRDHPNLGFPLQFRCKPYFYLHSGLIEKTQTTSPITLVNEGNVPAKPLIKVAGTSEGAIICGDRTLFIEGFSGVSHIMIDCEAKRAYTGTPGSLLDPLVLMNSRITGEWLRIPEGSSFLSWMMGVTSVTVTPRWIRV